MTDISKQVETHFHKTYKEFDSFYEAEKGPLARIIDRVFRRSMQLRFEKVIAGVSPYPGKTVLDVGCGAGRYCFVLASKGVERTFGIDFADNMIAEAQRRAIQFKMESICRFIKGNFIELPAHETERAFHHVFAVGVLDYIEDPVSFVRKMIDASTQTVMVSFPSKGGIVQMFRKMIFLKIKKCPIFFYSEADVNRIAQEAGAHHFHIDRLSKDYFLTVSVNSNNPCLKI